MALTLFLLASLLEFGYEITATSAMGNNPKTTIDSKRRHDVVDEAFLEQKDILLDMLESKLKEVRDKKKKKSDSNNNDGTKCEALPSNVDLKLKASGLSAIGESDIALKFGNSGKGTLNLDASGISNVGKARLDLGVGDGGIYIPGLNNLFVGKSFMNNCEKLNETDFSTTKTQNFGNDMLDFRRSGDNARNNGTNENGTTPEFNIDNGNNTVTEETTSDSTTTSVVDSAVNVDNVTTVAIAVTASSVNSTISSTVQLENNATKT